MKISDLELKLLKNISRASLIKGRKILESNRIIRVSGKNINGIYNLYGKIKCDSNIINYNPHLRIDLKSGKILLTKCECFNLELEDNCNSIFICEHLASIIIKFFDKAKKQIELKNRYIKEQSKKDLSNNLIDYITKENRDKKQLEIDVALKEVKDKSRDYFEASFFVGITTKNLINIKEFIECVINRKNFYIGKGLNYNYKNHYFNEEDENLINFIEEYLSICKNDFKGDAIKIFPENLRSFLNIISGKKIKFKYDYQSYLCDIKKTNLPISFTLKKIKDNYVLRTKKIFPIPLNNKMNVFLYDREIYISPINHLKAYSKLYKEFKENKEIRIYQDVDIEKLNNLILLLDEISTEFNIDQDIINDLDKLIDFKFNFSKKLDKKNCEVKIIKNKEEIDYSDERLIFDRIFKMSRKIKNIERELNKYRFYYIDRKFIFQGNDDEYYEFLKSGINHIKKIGEINDLKEMKDFKLYNSADIKYFFNKDKEENVKFSFLLSDLSNKDLNTIYNAWKEKRTYIKLEDGSFVNLEDEEVLNFLRLIENLNIDLIKEDDSYLIDENKLYYLNEKLNKEGLNIKGKEVLNEVLDKLNYINKEEFRVPKNLKASLREYQTNGYKWLKSLSYLGFGGILSDEMGLGKTIQIIAFLLSESNTRSLVITPTSLIYNWYEEFRKFAPSLKIGIVHGELKNRTKVLEDIKKYDVLITTYGTLRNDCLKYENIKFDNLIIDEAQNINNPKAKVTEAVKSIDAKIKFALTGTPVENNLIDLWSLFDFIMPGYLFTKEVFSKKFINKEEKSKQELRIMIKPYILRRLKSDVIKELPDKIENKFFVEMTTDQKKIYKIYIKDIQNKLKQIENSNNRITIFSYLTRLRQLCLDPSLIIEEYKGGSGKINVAKELIKKSIENNHKILLFSQFTSVLHKVCDELKNEKIEYLYLDGSTTSKERIKLVEEFNNNEKLKIFLISLKAGGTGLNLTSADMVIHFDPWWNPAIEEQATDRAHRIGQRNVVQVIKLITKESIEEKILLLQDDKKALIEDIITGELKEERLINKLGREELLDLLMI
ncbi:DEAD/DEAH box helicase [Clostridium sp. YB-6]|uniref:DEAD/DEAH box helicase n=1 Tax=Clostridium weizhouense TaxID=2859781 RepID=A0ABS7APG4_9CLOT|nr:DEAD/DEAH box helicase [Clostridium weizhouense]